MKAAALSQQIRKQADRARLAERDREHVDDAAPSSAAIAA